jgi:hypothetical protein
VTELNIEATNEVSEASDASGGGEPNEPSIAATEFLERTHPKFEDWSYRIIPDPEDSAVIGIGLRYSALHCVGNVRAKDIDSEATATVAWQQLMRAAYANVGDRYRQALEALSKAMEAGLGEDDPFVGAVLRIMHAFEETTGATVHLMTLLHQLHFDETAAPPAAKDGGEVAA